MNRANESPAMAEYDLAIIGGGINGTGIARDAAGRGLRVLLLEQSDLASGTSSASTKLIHGGLRYLEHGWFSLVRQALAERDVLMAMAPHLIRPIRLVLPHEPGTRSFWLLRSGLFIYDHLGGRKFLPATRTLDLSRNPLGLPLQGRYRRGFAYSDCRTDDARLVVLNAIDAAERGAAIRTRTRCIRADRSDIWRIVLESRGRRDIASARALVNATGPWAGIFDETILQRPAPLELRLDQGTHIVVRRLFEHDCGYIVQAPDGRIVFALPFEANFTLIGTTDRSFSGDPGLVSPTVEETSYLCAVINDHFRARISAADVVWSFSGVRALYQNGSSKPQDTPRDYVLALDAGDAKAPLLTVYGGKLTTYRRLAEEALNRLAPLLGNTRKAWTRRSRLPGGDVPIDGIERFLEQTRAAWPFLTEGHARRLAASYGTRVERILGGAKNLSDLGPVLGVDLTGAEVRYLMAHEWAQTEDDVLWRRSKLGLTFSRAERQRLGRFMADAIGTI
jgi:glycerol-3-phosphate dehydrogenase